MTRNFVGVFVDGETFELKDVLMGGTMLDGKASHVGMYKGENDLMNIGVAFLHTVRTVARVLSEDIGMSTDDIHEFVAFSVSEALAMECLEINKIKFCNSTKEFMKKQFGKS